MRRIYRVEKKDVAARTGFIVQTCCKYRLRRLLDLGSSQGEPHAFLVQPKVSSLQRAGRCQLYVCLFICGVHSRTRLAHRSLGLRHMHLPLNLVEFKVYFGYLSFHTNYNISSVVLQRTWAWALPTRWTSTTLMSTFPNHTSFPTRLFE